MEKVSALEDVVSYLMYVAKQYPYSGHMSIDYWTFEGIDMDEFKKRMTEEFAKLNQTWVSTWTEYGKFFMEWRKVVKRG